MAIGRSQISKQIEGKLRGARDEKEKKKKLQVKKKPNSKKSKVFKV